MGEAGGEGKRNLTEETAPRQGDESAWDKAGTCTEHGCERTGPGYGVRGYRLGNSRTSLDLALRPQEDPPAEKACPSWSGRVGLAGLARLRRAGRQAG